MNQFTLTSWPYNITIKHDKLNNTQLLKYMHKQHKTTLYCKQNQLTQHQFHPHLQFL